jgi:L-2,4-diaminobutyrate transaminase
MLRNDQLDQWDRSAFFHPSTHLGQFARGEMPNRIMTGGNGVYIQDRDGNQLLDALLTITLMSGTGPRSRSRSPI